MAKDVYDIVLDQALNYLRNNVTRVFVCSGEPSTYASAIAASMFLASVSVTSTNFSVLAGSASGRRIRSQVLTGFSVQANGNASWIVWADGSLTSILAKTSLGTSQTLTANNPCQINAIDYEITDPT